MGPLGDISATSKANAADLLNELKLLALGQYFAKTFQARAIAEDVSLDCNLPGMCIARTVSASLTVTVSDYLPLMAVFQIYGSIGRVLSSESSCIHGIYHILHWMEQRTPESCSMTRFWPLH